MTQQCSALVMIRCDTHVRTEILFRQISRLASRCGSSFAVKRNPSSSSSRSHHDHHHAAGSPFLSSLSLRPGNTRLRRRRQPGARCDGDGNHECGKQPLQLQLDIPITYNIIKSPLAALRQTTFQLCTLILSNGSRLSTSQSHCTACENFFVAQRSHCSLVFSGGLR